MRRTLISRSWISISPKPFRVCRRRKGRSPRKTRACSKSRRTHRPKPGESQSRVARSSDALERRSSAATAHARLEESTQRATALERELQAILTSRSWRLTAPLRRFTEALRRRTFITAPVGALAGMRRWVRERTTRRRNYALAAESGLFDATWYRERYPDVGRSNVDPLVHYLKWGGIETRDPHPLFDARYYVAQTGPLPPDTSPLLHYVTIGAREGRDPHPLFSSSFYLESNPDVAAAGVNPLAHYLERGAREGRDPHPLFDSSFYLQSNPDVAAAGVNPLVHYLRAGARGRAAIRIPCSTPRSTSSRTPTSTPPA